MDDVTIVELYLARDEAAISETEAKYAPYMKKIASNILGREADAEECVNDAYFKVWNSIPPHKPEKLRTYLAMVTRRVAIDALKKRKAEKRALSEYEISLDELGECVSGDGSPEDELDSKELGAAISRFLDTLPGTTKTVFVGRYYFLDSVKEVASYTGMSESKVKSMLFRLRKMLRDCLKSEGYEV